MSDLPVETCRTLTATLARVGDKWSMMIIVSLEHGRLRFNDLRRRIGISQKVLTSTLRGLERD
ncbi:winged helix-turn-helix transcriptional regulator, partial [Sphingomonas bacterium]|uniref:winged helix-turn-helix transcriptional regulator n=1 Tax=Sphingomonas bacterium TaxID=1895847 RepID=UPI001575D9BD